MKKPFFPGSTLDWRWDWSAWLSAGETITVASVTLEQGLTQVGGLTTTSNSVTAVLTLDAGVPLGASVFATCRITTNQGRTDSRALELVATRRGD